MTTGTNAKLMMIPSTTVPPALTSARSLSVSRLRAGEIVGDERLDRGGIELQFDAEVIAQPGRNIAVQIGGQHRAAAGRAAPTSLSTSGMSTSSSARSSSSDDRDHEQRPQRARHATPCRPRCTSGLPK